MTLQEQLRKLTTGGPGVTHIASETLFEDCAQKLDDDWKDSQALMKLLADEKHKVAALEARCLSSENGFNNACQRIAELEAALDYAHNNLEDHGHDLLSECDCRIAKLIRGSAKETGEKRG